MLAASKIGSVTKYTIIPKAKDSSKKYMAVWNIYGSTCTLLVIFLIILPLLDRYPVLITSALG